MSFDAPYLFKPLPNTQITCILCQSSFTRIKIVWISFDVKRAATNPDSGFVCCSRKKWKTYKLRHVKLHGSDWKAGNASRERMKKTVGPRYRLSNVKITGRREMRERASELRIKILFGYCKHFTENVSSILKLSSSSFWKLYFNIDSWNYFVSECHS